MSPTQARVTIPLSTDNSESNLPPLSAEPGNARAAETLAPVAVQVAETPTPEDVRAAETLAPDDLKSAETLAPDDLKSAETLAPADVDPLAPTAEPPGRAPSRQRDSRQQPARSQRSGTGTSPRERDGVATHGLTSGVVVDGQYELIRELGRGGMGVVFLARDIRLGRLVAVKFVLVRDTAASRRFLAEARTTARCTHQNIVVVHEADEFNGLPYMVLEYLPGKTLRYLMDEHADDDAIDARGLSPARTLEIMLPVLRALERAHGMGIVHRDLKPENVILTDNGVVKVLDFGIAKSVGAVSVGDVAVNAERPPGQEVDEFVAQAAPETKAGGLVGTLPYMSPEQLNASAIDHRVDIWAAGIMLFEMIAGRHPMAPLSMIVFHDIADVDAPMPRAGDQCPEVGALGPIIDRCLLKDKADRIGSVTELIAELLPHVPGHRSLALTDDASPFTGLSAFQESDADRFFGRSEDTLSVVSRVREQPLVAVIGPSGAGKSSLVRAGVIPALKRSGEGWQSFIARPGRAPLLALAEMIDRLGQSASSGTRRRLPTRPGLSGHAGVGCESDEVGELAGRDAVVARLRAEPGYLGTALRTYAQRKLRQVLLFVDQFEEVYTLCADEDERATFLACLAGVADDAGSPLRVVLSMRADFLERLAENRSFMGLATRGLMLLPPMGRSGLRAALEKPLAAVGYGFESEDTVRDMLDGLEGTRGALPLLQFAATTLWKERDRERQLFTENSYRAMGGIAGTLAKHADSVVAAMPEARRKLARAVFERLVTPERTRAVVSVGELCEMGGVDGDAVLEVLDELARARLVVVDTGSVEIVHESLIERWPTLRRWLDENQEDAAFLARLRTAAREWDGSGQAEGMLWSGRPAAEAWQWRQHYAGELSRLEQRFLDAVFALSRRARVRRRRLIYAAVAALVLVVMAGAYAVILARSEAVLARSLADETQAREDAAKAKVEAEKKAREAKAAHAAESEAKEEAKQRAQEAKAAEAEARKAEADARNAETEARAAEAKVKAANDRIVELLAEARKERKRAVDEAENAKKARQEAEDARREAVKARGEVEKKNEEIQQLIDKQGIKKLALPGEERGQVETKPKPRPRPTRIRNHDKEWNWRHCRHECRCVGAARPRVGSISAMPGAG